jgi:hypothetical protein
VPRIEGAIRNLDAEGIGELRAGQQRSGVDGWCDFLDSH